MNATTLTLTALASLRLTRFITRDTLGDWLIVSPLEQWAKLHDGAVNPETGNVISPQAQLQYFDDFYIDPDLGWRSKLVSGLSCPHCVGYWIGATVLVAAHGSKRSPRARKVFSAVAGSLALSYVTGHISQRMDA